VTAGDDEGPAPEEELLLLEDSSIMTCVLFSYSVRTRLAVGVTPWWWSTPVPVTIIVGKPDTTPHVEWLRGLQIRERKLM